MAVIRKRSSAEGRMCESCRRRLLAGETYELMDHPGRRIFRRAVCALCRRRALSAGWVVSPSVTAPPEPPPELADPFDPVP